MMSSSLGAQLNGILLKVKSRDYHEIYEIAFTYGLYEMTWEELYNTLNAKSSDGLITRHSFSEFFIEKGSRSSFGEDSYKKILGIFDCFDRTGSDFCDVDELTCGLSLFIRGTKSNKLLKGFTLMDEDNDGYLTRRGTWRFFRSFLGVLVAMSSAFQGSSSTELNTLLDDVSVQVTSEILDRGNVTKISFDSISEWYGQLGYVESTWIELLDLKKWVNAEDAMQASGDGDEEEEEEEEEEETAFRATPEDMVILKIASDTAMSITSEDTQRVLNLASLSGLHSLDAHLLRDTLFSFSTPSGELSPSGFLNFINEIMPRETAMRDAERDAVARALFHVYYVFEESGNIRGPAGLVDTRSLVAGLSLLCMGSKSSKLGVGFSLYSEDGSSSGALYIDDLRKLLESYLLSLQALDVLPKTEQGSLAEPVASILALVMGGMEDGGINFVSFGKWYNHTGCHYAPWIELLNLNKWLKIIETADEVGGGAESDTNDSNHRELGALDDESALASSYNVDPLPKFDTSDNPDCFSIVFNSQYFERRVSVARKCAYAVDAYTREFLTDVQKFGELVHAMELISEGGLLSRGAFKQVLTQLNLPVDLDMPGRVISSHSDTPTEGSFVMAVFDTLDRSNSSDVDVCDLIIALSTLLHTGSKSEKLAFAFDLLDENGEGRLTRRNLWRFFRSFIATILLLACPEVSPGDFLQILADEAAAWVTSCVFDNVKNNQTDLEAGMSTDVDELNVVSVTFDDIAEWYASQGCQTSSWIELLNMSKWIALVQPGSDW